MSEVSMIGLASDNEMRKIAADLDGNLNNNLATALAGEDLDTDVIKVEQRYEYHYIASPVANEIIKAAPGFLHAIILGKWVTGGTIEVSDHVSDGDGNVKIKLTAGGTSERSFPKTILVDAEFDAGICVDVVGLMDITLIWR